MRQRRTYLSIVGLLPVNIRREYEMDGGKMSFVNGPTEPI